LNRLLCDFRSRNTQLLAASLEARNSRLLAIGDYS